MARDVRTGERPTLEEQRRETLEALKDLFGSGRIGAEEFERRSEVARRSRDETELAAVRPERTEARHPAPSPARTPAPPRVDVDDEEETSAVFACMGSSVRKGTWEPPDKLYAVALMGGVELDFREAALLEGESYVYAYAIMGGVAIVVPPDIDVEVDGIGFMGGFEHVSRREPGTHRPLLRIKGLAVMGGVSVKVKALPGEGTMSRIARRVREHLDV